MVIKKQKYRTIVFYKNYFETFFIKQRDKVKARIVWTLELTEDLEKIPETYLKHIENTDGLLEIRVQQGNDIFRIFCFFLRRAFGCIGKRFSKENTKKAKAGNRPGFENKKKSMKTKKNNIATLGEFKDKHYGQPGTAARDNLDAGYGNFKIGALLHEARLEKGLTQEELAQKVGTTKSYISKIENNLKEVRISTLQKIVEIGLEGHIKLSIKL